MDEGRKRAKLEPVFWGQTPVRWVSTIKGYNSALILGVLLGTSQYVGLWCHNWTGFVYQQNGCAFLKSLFCLSQGLSFHFSVRSTPLLINKWRKNNTDFIQSKLGFSLKFFTCILFYVFLQCLLANQQEVLCVRSHGSRTKKSQSNLAKSVLLTVRMWAWKSGTVGWRTLVLKSVW